MKYEILWFSRGSFTPFECRRGQYVKTYGGKKNSVNAEDRRFRLHGDSWACEKWWTVIHSISSGSDRAAPRQVDDILSWIYASILHPDSRFPEGRHASVKWRPKASFTRDNEIEQLVPFMSANPKAIKPRVLAMILFSNGNSVSS